MNENPEKWLQQLADACDEPTPTIDVRRRVLQTLSQTPVAAPSERIFEAFAGASVGIALTAVCISSSWQTLLEPWISYFYL